MKGEYLCLWILFLVTERLVAPPVDGRLVAPPVDSPCTVVTGEDRRVILLCNGTDSSFTALPTLSVPEYSAITDIVISDALNFTFLVPEAFHDFTALEKVKIVDSGLKYISKDAFRLTNLTSLSLIGNPIEYLPIEVQRSLQARSTLTFDSEVLRCNCSASWLQIHVLLSNHSVLDGRIPLLCSDNVMGPYDITDHNFTQCFSYSPVISPWVLRNLHVNDSFTAVCSHGANADRKLVVQWIVGVLFSEYSLDETEAGVVLNVTRLRAEDSGVIRCTSGRSSSELRLAADFAPVVMHYEITTLDLQHACLIYSVIGTPSISLRWFHTNDSGITELHPSEYQILRETTVPDTDGINGCFQLRDLSQPEVRHTFTILASNRFGSTNQTLTMGFTLSQMSEFPGNFPPGWLVTTPSAEQTGLEQEILGGILGGLALIAILIISVLLVQHWRGGSVCRKRGRGILGRSGGQKGLQGIILKENPNYLHQQDLESSNVPILDKECLTAVKTLGEGAFGFVYLGTCVGLAAKGSASDASATDGADETPVAIKVLKGSAKDESIASDFQREAELMAGLTHEHVVRMHGVCFDGSDMMMVFEYMELGDLNNYLREHGPDSELLGNKVELTDSTYNTHEGVGGTKGQSPTEPVSQSNLLRMTSDAAKGMAYLATKRLVHRDLAARNCLVRGDLLIKIGDFGMSRDIYGSEYYKIGNNALLPIRWMAPECLLYRRFTIESDVWSFGVLMWEILTYARQPWFEYCNSQVATVIQQGRWLSPPDDCPSDVYDLMTSCWARQPEDRPKMAAIEASLSSMVVKYSLQPTTAEMKGNECRPMPDYVNTSAIQENNRLLNYKETVECGDISPCSLRTKGSTTKGDTTKPSPFVEHSAGAIVGSTAQSDNSDISTTADLRADNTNSMYSGHSSVTSPSSVFSAPPYDQSWIENIKPNVSVTVSDKSKMSPPDIDGQKNLRVDVVNNEVDDLTDLDIDAAKSPTLREFERGSPSGNSISELSPCVDILPSCDSGFKLSGLSSAVKILVCPPPDEMNASDGSDLSDDDAEGTPMLSRAGGNVVSNVADGVLHTDGVHEGEAVHV